MMHSNSKNTAAIFDKIFKETWSGTVAYLIKISNNKELAEDLAQEAYLKAWQKFHLLPVEESEIARYILVIARNCFLDHLKAALRERKQHDAYTVSFPESGHFSPAMTVIEAKEQQQIVNHTINNHEETVRRYYLLNREYGLTYKEIALQEGVSEKTVERYIGRVLRSLRSRLASFFFIW
ncbi:sigma-70 family RNA polymerase sigma factor [Chitinophaga sp.]|uniref:RNA polymerase sigma factor n=1 Tax=Chitinophaga sp. TaxID=1869181 RepID=UPI0031E1A850